MAIAKTEQVLLTVSFDASISEFGNKFQNLVYWENIDGKDSICLEKSKRAELSGRIKLQQSAEELIGVDSVSDDKDRQVMQD